MTIEGRKTAKVDGGYDGGKYIKKVNIFAITCKYWWRGKDLNLRHSGYEPDELPACSTPLLEMRNGRSEFWSERPVSNRRPSAWKADALPTELLSLYKWLIVVVDKRICQYNSTCDIAISIQ